MGRLSKRSAKCYNNALQKIYADDRSGEAVNITFKKLSASVTKSQMRKSPLRFFMLVHREVDFRDLFPHTTVQSSHSQTTRSIISRRLLAPRVKLFDPKRVKARGAERLACSCNAKGHFFQLMHLAMA